MERDMALGVMQIRILEMLRDVSPWHRDCDWYFSGRPAATERTLHTLVRYGLVNRTPYVNGSWLYEINENGKEFLNER
jgi:hypothetical protein